MKIDLPYPHKALWPNGRAHYRAKAREAKKHRQWAYLCTLADASGAKFHPSAITIRVHAKRTGPMPDRDNVVAAAKSLLDGIADALDVNDRNFPEPKVEFAPERDGRFVVELTR